MTNIWKEFLRAAEIIDGWTGKQRKDYLRKLKKREKKEGKTIYRNIVKMMLTGQKRRKRFIKIGKKFSE